MGRKEEFGAQFLLHFNGVAMAYKTVGLGIAMQSGEVQSITRRSTGTRNATQGVDHNAGGVDNGTINKGS